MIDRRKMLAGLAGMGAATALPAWAQAIRPQSDPYAQVDPYADPRNGFPSGGAQRQGGSRQGGARDVFDHTRQSEEQDLTLDEEIVKAKASFAEGIAEGGGLVPDERVQKAMADFVSPFVKASSRPNLPWEVAVLRTTEINAWAAGGGKMAFYAGLIAMCDSPGELAAVVAHEIGHTDLGHCAARHQLSKAIGIAQSRGMDRRLPMDALIGANPMNLRSTFDVLVVGYDRTQEFEADEYSLDILERGGMSATAALDLLIKFTKMDLEHGHHIVKDVAVDHPNSAARLANVRAAIGIGDGRDLSKRFVPKGWDVLKAAFPTPAKYRT